ncbi:Ig-like domain-containing protein [Candidatus Pacearchaeota archaeon]|nr:Ig-like domain-containing protein [Candidatus Pacearchaeota archaeon]
MWGILFKPFGALKNNLVYSMTISKNITDLAGNKLGSDYVFSFKTV